jgi:ATP-dependent RNA helicase DeaD
VHLDPHAVAHEPKTMSESDPFAGVPKPLAEAMQRRGFAALTAVQQAVLEAESAGQDLRISSQTGSGKTVALGLALGRHFIAGGVPGAGPAALIIAPTRELAMQLREELGWLFSGLRGVQIDVAMGGTDVLAEQRRLSRKPAVVVGTPGRILDHFRSGALHGGSIAHVVLDEADQMLDMGFREELDAILEHLPRERRSHLVSATFPHALKSLADRFQREPLHLEGTALGAAHQDIVHVAHVIRPRETYAALVNVLLLMGGSRCLIFVQRRVDATRLAEKLAKDGFAASAFSGDLAQAQRTRTLAAFRGGSIEILVSTDVAARGIDVPDIASVIHADPPQDAEGYVHRSGRTGRAGQKGLSVLLVPTAAERRIRRLLGHARVALDWQPAPGPEKVRKALQKRGRRLLRARLEGEDSATEEQRAQAAKLLEGADPVEVVARLLEMSVPAPVREPMDLDTAAQAPRRPRDQTFVRFRVNWGERKGATAGRVLSHVCRRTGIPGHLVGGIKVGPHEATIEVATEAAERFAERVRRPDDRDPEVEIRRDGSGGRGPDRRGPRPGNSAPRPAKPAPRAPRAAAPPTPRKRKPFSDS